MQTHKIIEMITGEKWPAKALEKGQIITLKYPGKCKQCKAPLFPGDLARWYGKGRIYGLHCHNGGTANDPNVISMDGEDFIKAFCQ